MAAQWAPKTEEEGPAPMALGERIRQLRKEAGWSQAELGEKVATDSQRISRYETAKIKPSVDAIIRIAEALNVSIDYLLVDDAPRRPFRSPDHVLGQRLTGLDELSEQDLDALLHILDALVAKNRVKAALTNRAG